MDIAHDGQSSRAADGDSGPCPKNGEGPPVWFRRPFACYKDLWIVIASPMSWTISDMIRSWRSPGFLVIALPPSSLFDGPPAGRTIVTRKVEGNSVAGLRCPKWPARGF
jgi:hypothetical protein